MAIGRQREKAEDQRPSEQPAQTRLLTVQERRKSRGRRAEDREAYGEIDVLRTDLNALRDDLKEHVDTCTLASQNLRNEVKTLAKTLSKAHKANVKKLEKIITVNHEQMTVLDNLVVARRLMKWGGALIAFLVMLAEGWRALH